MNLSEQDYSHIDFTKLGYSEKAFRNYLKVIDLIKPLLNGNRVIINDTVYHVMYRNFPNFWHCEPLNYSKKKKKFSANYKNTKISDIDFTKTFISNGSYSWRMIDPKKLEEFESFEAYVESNRTWKTMVRESNLRKLLDAAEADRKHTEYLKRKEEWILKNSLNS